MKGSEDVSYNYIVNHFQESQAEIRVIDLKIIRAIDKGLKEEGDSQATHETKGLEDKESLSKRGSFGISSIPV